MYKASNNVPYREGGAVRTVSHSFSGSLFVGGRHSYCSATFSLDTITLGAGCRLVVRRHPVGAEPASRTPPTVSVGFTPPLVNVGVTLLVQYRYRTKRARRASAITFVRFICAGYVVCAVKCRECITVQR